MDETLARLGRPVAVCGLWLAVALTGCGTLKSTQATEQMLLSDAVDRAVAQIDFTVLSGERVYLDDTYLKSGKPVGFVNQEYVISSLRNQMFAANCRVQDCKEDADIIVEARLGALATDSHEVTYGLPASHSFSSAAALMPSAPNIPLVPEISFGKRSEQAGAAKLAVFAYHRESREPYWQSGVASERSTARDTWVLGAGPFQRGSIYDGTRFAGSRLQIPVLLETDEEPAELAIPYHREMQFTLPEPEELEIELEFGLYPEGETLPEPDP